MVQFVILEKIKLQCNNVKNEAAAIFETDVDVDFNIIITTVYCFVKNKSITFATFLTFK